MGNKEVSLKKLLKEKDFPIDNSKDYGKIIEKLQLQLVRIQQGVWHSRRRVIILFEGFDAAGKGGSIRRLTEHLDPRGVKVHAFGPPSAEEQGRHYLYRFWQALPQPGECAIFDRTWYGRVLVELVEKLTPNERLDQAYDEINQTEKMLIDDGIDVIKFFLAVSPEEQLKRFKARLKDPYKQWKLTPEDVEARKKWDDYVNAAEKMFKKTHTADAPWHLIPGDHKHYARRKVLEITIKRLEHHSAWLEKEIPQKEAAKLKKALKRLKKE
jgi:polyphosphate kinase 2 (PPK2 family)